MATWPGQKNNNVSPGWWWDKTWDILCHKNAPSQYGSGVTQCDNDSYITSSYPRRQKQWIRSSWQRKTKSKGPPALSKVTNPPFIFPLCHCRFRRSTRPPDSTSEYNLLLNELTCKWSSTKIIWAGSPLPAYTTTCLNTCLDFLTKYNSLYALCLQDLNDPEASLQLQPQFGSRLGPEDFLLFQVQTHKPDETAYLLDLYCGDPQAPDAEPPDHVGFACVLPSMMRASEGFYLVLPITSTKHRLIGQLSSRYLFIYTYR